LGRENVNPTLVGEGKVGWSWGTRGQMSTSPLPRKKEKGEVVVKKKSKNGLKRRGVITAVGGRRKKGLMGSTQEER